MYLMLNKYKYHIQDSSSNSSASKQLDGLFLKFKFLDLPTCCLGERVRGIQKEYIFGN